MISRANKACKYFPCHKNLEDCTFCYCPFYPCLNETRGGEFIYSKKTEKRIWSCQNCSWIHQRNITDKILSIIRKNKEQIENINIENDKLEDTGFVILCHGSKQKKTKDTVNNLIETIKKRLSHAIVTPSYLQLCEPGLSKSIKFLVEKGCKKIVVVSFFLFNGNHVKIDIPEILETEKKKYPGVRFIQTKSIGDNKMMNEIVIEKIKEAIKIADF
jgi:Zn-finger protein